LLEGKAFKVWITYPSTHVEYIEEKSTDIAFHFIIRIIAILVFVLFNVSKNILVGKLEWKRQLGRPNRRWDANVKINLEEIDWKIVEWIHMAQDLKIGSLFGARH
jgi:hypothetical protein